MDRLDRIEERLEGVLQTLELTASMVRDNEARMALMETHLDRILTTVEKLADIAHNHERRIQGLEGQDH